MKQRIFLSLGIIFIVGGLVICYRPVMNWWHQHDAVNSGPAVHYSVPPSATESNKVITGEPATLDIPSVNINLPVIDGFYNSQSKAWTLTLDKAQYATITPAPNNQGGNTFIYGHNRWEVFYRLPKIQIGAEATITTTNHHKFIYKLSSVKTTSPNDTSLFTYKGPPMLTLQTCTGLWYQNRTLFSFQLVEAS